MCVLQNIRWGSSATHPATVSTLQNSGLFDNPQQTYDFSNIAVSGYWNIAVPQALGTINVVRFNGSPLVYLPPVDVVTSTVTGSDILAAAVTWVALNQSQPLFVVDGALYSVGSVATINDGAGNSMTGTVTSVIGNTVLATLTAFTGTGVAIAVAVSIATSVTYNIYRSDATFPGFTGLQITAT